MMVRTANELTDTDARVEARPERGPVRLLCDEIGFSWHPRLERQDLFVNFVGELAAEVAHMRYMAETIAEHGGAPPSDASDVVLVLTQEMLALNDREALILAAAAIHDAAHELNPEDAYPTDHLIDMLSSCASAIRFGLETPCRSRHAASAANHVFDRLYGLRLHDHHVPEWQKGWAREKLQAALVSLLLADGAPTRQDDTEGSATV
jgi:hypothetical protein